MNTVLLQRLAVLGVGTGCLLLAADEPKLNERVQVTNTQHFDLAAGGTVRLTNSTGELTIEGWDQPGVEMTTTKWVKDPATGRDEGSRELAQVRISGDLKGNELDITTEFPHSHLLPPSFPIGGATAVEIEYNIKVPRDTKLVVEHYDGEVYVSGVSNDIRATTRQGVIVLHLPENGQYMIEAKSAVGNVISDFPGTPQRRHLFGKELAQTSAAPHRLDLKDGYGDIMILKTNIPAGPSALNR